VRKSYRPKRGDLIRWKESGWSEEWLFLVVACSKHPGTPLWSLTLLGRGEINEVVNKCIGGVHCM